MEQNPIVIEFEGQPYQFQYHHFPPQNQTEEHIQLLFEKSDIYLIGQLTLDLIKPHFQNLQQFTSQFQNEIQEKIYNFQIVRHPDTNVTWFLYVNSEPQINIYCQLSIQEKQIGDIQQQKVQEYSKMVQELQSELDKNREILSKQEEQYQYLQENARNKLQNKKNQEQMEKNENKLRDVENLLNKIDTNAKQVQPTIEELKQIYYKKITFEDILNVYIQTGLTQSTIKKQPELKIHNGFAISQAYNSKQKLKFTIEDGDTNFTFGITPDNAVYESVNQIVNNNQAQYFFVPEGDYKQGQNKINNNNLQHVFGSSDTITLIVDPSVHLISVKINDVLVTNIRNKNMAKSYKFFLSVKDKQNLEGLIL